MRSSHQRCSIKKYVLRNLTKFIKKYLCQSLFINKVAGLRPVTLLKKSLWHSCFPVNFAKFLRTSFLQNTFRQLLLENIHLPFSMQFPQFNQLRFPTQVFLIDCSPLMNCHCSLIHWTN